MYRDFVYLDTGRIQSIIAQLEKGVLDKVLEGKSKELQGKAIAAAGILASFLPIGLEGSVTKRSDYQASKVIHDYAFNLALESLQKNEMCIDIVGEWDRNALPLPDTAFILVRGSVSILDYELIKSLAENETMLSMLFAGSQQSLSKTKPRQGGKRKPQQHKKSSEVDAIQQLSTLVDAMMGDTVQVRLNYSDNISFAGPLSREYLREGTRDLIFKYGGKPQPGWAMLAQISQVTEPSNKINAITEMTKSFSNIGNNSFGSLTDILSPLVEILNTLQEAIASVSYPTIAVTPIALYRELGGLK